MHAQPYPYANPLNATAAPWRDAVAVSNAAQITATIVKPTITPNIAPFSAGDPRCFHVNIGELRVGARTDQLQALLGSCVGIALLWKKRGRCGLAHCLLPESPVPPTELGARYVNQAVPSLLRLMGACVADYADIDVVVAGGGNMLEACSARFQIGQQNIDAALKHLGLHGLHVRLADVGGTVGRTLTVDCATQEVRVNAIQAQARVVHHA